MKNNEKWIDISGFRHKYQISNTGRVRNVLKTKPPKILKPQPTRCGYLRVNLYLEPYKFKTMLIHRLVAIYFIENPLNLEFVNHKNGIKTDNSIDNLEWCTKSQNSKHSFEVGLQCNKGSNHPQSKLTENIVKKIKIDIKKGLKNIDIANKYKCHRDTVSQIKREKQWQHVKLSD